MKTTQKIGLIPVILLCAAFAMVPMVAAAGPGQGINQGNNQGPGGSGPGPAQGDSMNQGPGGGQGGMIMPANGQDANQGTNDQNQGDAAVHQGPPGGDFGNMTGPGPDANMNAGNDTWSGPGNMAMNNLTFGPPPVDSNATADNNWTAPDAMPMEWHHGRGNITGLENNQTVPAPLGGNMTPPQTPSDNGNANGSQNQNGQNTGMTPSSVQQQGNSLSQAQGKDQKDNDLIAAFLKWLEGQSGSSS